MKVSEYVAKYLVDHGITQCFSVTGGFAMHLNDSFGEHLNVVYQHGESPCGYSAVGYSKMNQQPSVVCVTAGCGATNAVTPCLIAYQDSVPVFFMSGAVPHKENVRFLGHSTRTYSGSDCDIIDMVKNITKYSHELWDPVFLKSVLDQCLWNLTHGRPGPVWLSIPLDIQALQVPEQTLDVWFPPVFSGQTMDTFPMDAWMSARRPVVLVGNGVRTSGTTQQLEEFANRHQVPIVSSYFGTDLVPEFNVGRVGILGDRPGNFTLQNADFVLSLGCRTSKSIIGYRPEWFCREATFVSINIEDSHGHTIKMNLEDFFKFNLPVKDTRQWFSKTLEWKSKWARELPNPDSNVCPYNFMKTFFDKKPACENVVVSSGSIFCVAWHQCVMKPGDRYILSSHGDMGFEVPAAIGCALESKRTSWAIVGDGSFQYNVQELQTIKTLGVPVKILYFNNGGYGAIQITQDAYFKRRFGVEIQCPDVQKVCHAWDFPYFTDIQKAIEHQGCCLVEIKCIVQQRQPRLQNLMKADGTFENKPMEDMYPFLEREDFRVNMFVKEV
jgi:acetolactate synthase-1/2/3 large subunit